MKQILNYFRNDITLSRNELNYAVTKALTVYILQFTAFYSSLMKCIKKLRKKKNKTENKKNLKVFNFRSILKVTENYKKNF